MKEGNRVWVISEFYFPIRTGTGYYMTEIAEYISSKGYNTQVICTSAKYNETDYTTPAITETRNNVRINRILTGDINKNRFFVRMLKVLVISIKFFLKILSNVEKGDRILIVTNPAFLLLFMPLVKYIKKVEYTLLVHDIFPENLVAIGKISQESIIYKITKKIFDLAYAQAHTCIAIGRDMEKVLESKIGLNKKIILIPNWADVDDVYPMNKFETKLLSQFDLADKFIFQFAGNLGHSQGIDNILESIKLVKNPKLHFLFIGTGAKEAQISEFARANPLRNVSHLGFQKRSDQGDFLNACDVAIVTLADGMYGLGVPSKSYNIMAAGKPILIIANTESEISLCVKEHGLGWVVEPGNPIQLSEYYEQIYQDSLQSKLNQINTRVIAEKYFAKAVILEKYLDIIVQ